MYEDVWQAVFYLCSKDRVEFLVYTVLGPFDLPSLLIVSANSLSYDYDQPFMIIFGVTILS